MTLNPTTWPGRLSIPVPLSRACTASLDRLCAVCQAVAHSSKLCEVERCASTRLSFVVWPARLRNELLHQILAIAGMYVQAGSAQTGHKPDYGNCGHQIRAFGQ